VAKNKRQAPHCADTRAVNGTKGFAGIPLCVLRTEAYRTLSLMARAVLVEIVGRMNGSNNGQITRSYAQLAAALNRKNQAPIGPAIAELMQHGLLDISAESVWQERRAREYRLTFVNTTDAIGRTIRATNDYLRFDATDVVAVKAKSATTPVAESGGTATYAVAATNGKPPKTLNGSATTGVVPIRKPYVAAENGGHSPTNLSPEIAGGRRAAGAAT
jgi:hypothetical protein